MNRFAALDIDEFEPDQVEQERELVENVRAAKKAGLGPELEDLKKVLALQRWYDERNVGAVFTQYVISRGPPHVWRRKDGSTLFVEAMSDTHLLNSARLLMRKLEKERPQVQLLFSLKVLKLEANHRGRLL